MAELYLQEDALGVHKAQGHHRSPSVCAGGRQTRAQKWLAPSQVGFILSFFATQSYHVAGSTKP